MSDVDLWLEERTLLEAYAGSMVYGTSVEGSDIDLRGVAVPPAKYILGLENFEQRVQEEPDRTIYGIHKWFKLAAIGNPNILELLWTPENYFVKRTDLGNQLIEWRDMFLGKHVKKPYFAYASAQLSRIKKLNKNANTNPKRVVLVEKFGFDTKAASHAVRLMRMCFEILTEGILHVQRYDNRELRAIREGEWPYTRLLKEIERIENLVDEALLKTDLPSKVDRDLINERLMYIVRQML